jgi:hypothetical protein
MILSTRSGFLRILFINECQQNNDYNSIKYFDPIEIEIYLYLNNL